MASVVRPKSIQDIRKARVRKRLKLHATRPRLSVFRSNKYIYAQIIDDMTQKTLASASSVKDKAARLTVETARSVGKAIAEKAKEKDVKEVCFDRGCYAYHGRLKAFAEAAREGGLIF